MVNLRARATSWVARRYIARKQRTGFDLAAIRFLPDSVLVPLLRDGLEPVRELAQVRSEAPISKVPIRGVGFGVWLVTGYEEAKAVLGSADGFSNGVANLAGEVEIPSEWIPGGLGFIDPPVHTRRRKLLTPEFTMRRLSRLTPRINAIVEEQLDAMAAAEGQVDLVESFALPIPSLTICELLGVPYEDRAEFQRMSSARFDLFGGALASIGAMSESAAYLLSIVKKQRETPGDGLIGMLIREHGDTVDDEELAGLADGVLTGGHETTAAMLALGAIMLMRDQNQFKLIHDDDKAIVPFVDEMLRYLSVVQMAFPRFAQRDMEIGGVKIARRDVLLVSLSGANRDEALGPDMEAFDPNRKSASHVAFGWGMHRCIGAELAKMELRAAFPALVRRFPNMRLAVEPEGLSYRKLSAVHGVDALPVHLS
jgi:cytochrome P450